jgi:hypothetical protein
MASKFETLPDIAVFKICKKLIDQEIDIDDYEEVEETPKRVVSIEDLEHLQGIVGGLIEMSQGRYDGKNYTMWVNEEGLLHNLPVNKKATKAYQDYWFWYENENPGSIDRIRVEHTKIVGNVVLIDEQGE